MGLRTVDHCFAHSLFAVGSRTLLEHEKGGKAASSSPISMECPKCRRRSQKLVVRARYNGLVVALGCFLLDINSSDVGRNGKEPLAQRQHNCHDRRWLCLPCLVPLLGIYSKASPSTIPLIASPNKSQRHRRLRHCLLLFRRLLHLNPAVLLLVSPGRAKRFDNGGWPYRSNLYLYVHSNGDLYIACY